MEDNFDLHFCRVEEGMSKKKTHRFYASYVRERGALGVGAVADRHALIDDKVSRLRKKGEKVIFIAPGSSPSWQWCFPSWCTSSHPRGSGGHTHMPKQWSREWKNDFGEMETLTLLHFRLSLAREPKHPLMSLTGKKVRKCFDRVKSWDISL